MNDNEALAQPLAVRVEGDAIVIDGAGGPRRMTPAAARATAERVLEAARRAGEARMIEVAAQLLA